MGKNKRQFFATTAPGLESMLVAELTELGVGIIETSKGGVTFAGSLTEGCLVNLWSRCANRIVMRLETFRAKAFPELFKKASRIDWSAYIVPGCRVDVRASSKGSRLFHTRRLSETVLDAIAKKIEIAKGDEAPQQRIQVRLFDNEATISLDMSGERLHRRGYREETGRAPLRESMAAALLRWSGWQKEEPLIDPMCGSGTFPIEAFWIAQGRAPGLTRTFPFQTWPCGSVERWEKTLKKAGPHGGIEPLILGMDRDSKAVDAARQNAERAGCSKIAFSVADVHALQAPEGKPGLVVCNPPYGARIGSETSLIPVYTNIAEALKRCQGWRAVVLSQRPSLHSILVDGLGKEESRIVFEHGGLSVAASLFQL